MAFKGTYIVDNTTYTCTVTPEAYHIKIEYKDNVGASQQLYWNTDYVKRSKANETGDVNLEYSQMPYGKITVSDANFMPELKRLYPVAEFHQSSSSFIGPAITGLLVLTVLAVGLVAAGYFLIVPAVVDAFAKRIPVNIEEQLGDALFTEMTQLEKVNKPATENLNRFFSELHYKSDYNIKLTVIESDVVNAYALPGGNIVVYTGIINKMNSPGELVALLSHEFSHVQQRHSTRSVCRSMAGSLFLAVIFGDANGVTAAVIQNADQVRQLSYSRSLEEEADDEGIKLMRQNHIDLNGMKHLFQALQKEESAASQMPAFLSTHPLTQSRIKNVTEQIAKDNSPISGNAVLDSLWNRIKGQPTWN